MVKTLNNKGAALVVVLGTILVVVVLANLLLGFMLSQNRLTHHQISRIQAYYASMGAVNYAVAKIKSNEWVITVGDCVNTACCDPTSTPAAPCNVPYSAGDFFPPVINNVQVFITPRGTTNPLNGSVCDNPPNDVDACIDATTDYTYTP